MNCAGNRDTDDWGDRNARSAMHPDAVAVAQIEQELSVPLKNLYKTHT